MSHSANSDIVEVFDPEYKFVKEIPASLVRHLPPARLNITRLVFCRNYLPSQPKSCKMGDGCKFVHADVDPESLESHPIHVKYSWRHEDVCTYARLPAGDVLRVTAPNNRPPVEEIPSERILVTRGSLRFSNSDVVHRHCTHYYQHRMCNRGERCNFIHVVHVDPNVVGDFKRAPAVQVVVDADVMDALPDSGRRSSLDTEGPQTVGATMSAVEGCVTPRADLIDVSDNTKFTAKIVAHIVDLIQVELRSLMLIEYTNSPHNPYPSKEIPQNFVSKNFITVENLITLKTEDILQFINMEKLSCDTTAFRAQKVEPITQTEQLDNNTNLSNPDSYRED